jgi:hypothetical protein
VQRQAAAVSDGDVGDALHGAVLLRVVVEVRQRFFGLCKASFTRSANIGI